MRRWVRRVGFTAGVACVGLLAVPTVAFFNNAVQVLLGGSRSPTIGIC